MSVRARVLILAAAGLAIGCGGAGGGAAARPSPTASATTGAGAETAPEPTATASARKGVRLKRIGTFANPVYVTSPPGDRHRLFVVEQAGRIRVLVDGKLRSRPFLDIVSQVSSGGERGLLSVAFAPDYASSRLFYVDYTDRNGDTRIVEYKRASADRADPSSARQLIFQRQPEPNHNGGLLLFGPDKLLYVGFGDGGGGGDLHGAHGNAQNLGTLLGKILRIDPHASGGRPYGIPASNPFVNRAGARGEIWAYGLRNPWRFSFDPRSRALVIGDVGQDAVEEIDIVRHGGANLGWRVWEGRSRYTPGETAPDAQFPVIQRFHRDGNCSITGGIVVRDRRLKLFGRYIFGDLCKGIVQSFKIRGSKARSVYRTSLHVDALASFGVDGRRRAYAVSNAGPVYRLVPR
jgi:glucose/arabinose dehydrogenase